MSRSNNIKQLDDVATAINSSSDAKQEEQVPAENPMRNLHIKIDMELDDQIKDIAYEDRQTVKEVVVQILQAGVKFKLKQKSYQPRPQHVRDREVELAKRRSRKS